MGKYTYLMSSLHDLKLFDSGRNFTSHQLYVFCREQLHPQDLDTLKRLFLFNDIRNTVYLNYNDKKSQEDYARPSFYDEESFWLGRKDPAVFLPFLRRFYDQLKGTPRDYPDLPHTDELTFFFYEDVEDLVSGFALEWYLMERELRNLALTLTMVHEGAAPAGRLIPSGIVYEAVRESDNPKNWNLDKHLPWASQLITQVDHPLALERTLENIRWSWLEEQEPASWDSLEALMIYVIRLQTVERWEKLEEDAGKVRYNALLGTLNRSIRFAIEIANPGGNK